MALLAACAGLFLASFVPGVAALDQDLTGIISSGVVAGVVLVATLVIIVVLWYFSTEHKRRPTKKPRYDVNGNTTQNGIPLKEIRNGRPAVRPGPPRAFPLPPTRYMPRSYRGPPPGGPPPEIVTGTFRGAPPGVVMPGSMRGAPPPIMTFGPRGPYYPGMNPYFFRPVIYVDESDDDEHSKRSTLKERKKRYHRSMDGSKGRTASGVIIREVESSEDQVNVSKEERKQKDSVREQRKRKSRSRSPEKSRSKRSESPARVHEPEPYRQSRRKSVSEDEGAQIDEMFSGFSAIPQEGDVVFQKAEPKPARINTPPRSPPRSPPRTPSPVDMGPTTSNYQYSSVIQKDEPQPETQMYSSVNKNKEPDMSNVYASVIKNDRASDHERSHPLRQSMAERLEEIVQNRHEGRPTEFDEMEQDEETYPRKTYSLSHTQRSEMSASRREGEFLSRSRRRSSDSESDRPETPPDDYPASATVSPRESFIRQEAPAATRVPQMDLRSSVRPVTPPFDGTDRTERPARMEKDDIKGAFSNQVLQELRLRQRGGAQDDDVDDDDDDDRSGRAVNFSVRPPEIIPRSEPNSPRGPPPPVAPGVIPPAPPAPPPPPPPVPK